MVGTGVLVVAGGDTAPLFKSAEATFDGVALPGELGVKRWWASTGGAVGLAVFDLVTAFGNGVAQTSAAELLACRGMAVGLIREQVRWSVASVGQGVEQRDQAGVVGGLSW